MLPANFRQVLWIWKIGSHETEECVSPISGWCSKQIEITVVNNGFCVVAGVELLLQLGILFVKS